MSAPSCVQRARIDAHFAGRNTVAEEAEMRQHLLDCPACRRRYQRQALLARVRPGSLEPEERLAIGLGLARRRRPRALPGLLTAVAVCGVLVFALGSGTEGGAFRPRGPGDGAGAELLVFKVRPGEGSTAVGERFAAGDELAFAYRNGAGKRHLFVFGVDEHGHVFWFSPAWTDDAREPAAPTAAGLAGLHEIEDAVGHRYDGQVLDIHGLFTDRDLGVREIESRVTRTTAGASPFDAADIDVVHRFEVTP
jgi:hypothetical protein